MATENDIRIAENGWISWVEFDPMDKEATLDIEDLFEPTVKFWNGLEKYCLIECCGIDALSFWKDDIIQSSKRMDRVKLISDLHAIKAAVLNSSKTIISSHLNSLLDKGVFLQLIDHVLSTLETESR